MNITRTALFSAALAFCATPAFADHHEAEAEHESHDASHGEAHTHDDHAEHAAHEHDAMHDHDAGGVEEAAASASDAASAIAVVAPGTLQVQVNGLVCDFCAQALNRVLTRRAEIAEINVDLDTRIVTIDMEEGGEIDDETLTGLINDAGYDVVAIHRPEV